MTDITDTYKGSYWGMCRNLSNVACKWVRAPYTQPSWTAKDFWDDSQHTTTIPAECLDGSFAKYPAITYPGTGYDTLMIRTTAPYGSYIKLPNLAVVGEGWDRHGFCGTYWMANSSGAYLNEITPAPTIPGIEIIDTSSYAGYALFIGGGLLQYTSEILAPELIQLPYHYEITSSISYDFGYTDQVTLSGRVSRLRTNPPAINLQWDYTVNSNTANEISQLLTKSCNQDYSVEIAWDEIDEPTVNPVKLIIGKGPSLSQRDRNNWSFSVQGRIGQ